MGQKVNPIGMRIGIIRDWNSKWIAPKKDVPALIKEDHVIRTFIKKFYKTAAVAQVDIERIKNKDKSIVRIYVHSAKPRMVIGQDAVTKKAAILELEKLTKKTVQIQVIGVNKAERYAVLVAQSIADQLENRASFRRVQKIAIQRALKAGAKGCKTVVSGRLGGAEMARREGYSEGRVPLHTFRADIDYAWAEALTTYGKLGVKVWIYNGEVLPGQTRESIIAKQDSFNQRPGRDNKAPRQNDRRPRPNTKVGGSENVNT